MPKTRAQKKVILDGLDEKAQAAKSVVFAKFAKLNVKENEDLRKRLKAEGGEYYVAKKTLFNLAFKEKHPDVDFKNMDGQVAAVFGYQDEVAPAKVVDTFRKEMEEPKIFFLGGILENKFIPAEMVEMLAKLPSKKELYAKLVGSLNSPVSGFVNVLAGNLRGLLTCLKAIGEKK
ncbi:MAG TPA: 50S ribosomal protein L10 [Candidatus Methylomirabilis sp.]|nr:50S ribosomal protein L10 [Candidatus Methylomirabilis sp.]